ncbi:MAG: hypothetical protein JKY34_02475 [Kordiimonadaceae bacterium]|nr:hypothetical protein [Kordiimonadaceae bacterium]
MTFTVKVHNDVLGELGALPDSIKSEAKALLSMVTRGGHTSLQPSVICQGPHNRFTIFAGTIDPATLIFKNGVAMTGFFPVPFSQTYYIEDIRQAVDGWWLDTDGMALTFHLAKDDEYTGVYTVENIDQNYTPLPKKFYTDAPPSFDPMKAIMSETLDSLFYSSLRDVSKTIDHRKLTGADRPFPSRLVGLGHPTTRDIDVRYKAGYDNVTINHMVGSLIDRKGRLCLVNWVDETDPWSMTHREIAPLLSFAVRKIYPDIHFHVLNLTIRDELGNEPYMQDFQAFKKQMKLKETMAYGACILGRAVVSDGSGEESVRGLAYASFNVFQHAPLYQSFNNFAQNSKIDEMYKKSLSFAIENTLKIASRATSPMAQEQRCH